MSKPTTRELMLARKAELETDIAAVEAKAAPLRAKREALRTQIQPLEDEIRALNVAIKEVEQPHLSELKMEYADLARALGSKRMRAEGAAVQVEG